MKKPSDEGLTKLANAAFEQAAHKVIERAVDSGTPVIVCVDEEVKAVEPQAVRNGSKRARLDRSGVRHGD
jgi:hypothetical protein